MMTKRQLCEYIVTRRAKELGLDYENKQELVSHVFSSTNLGIALEYLGFINPKDTPTEYEYLQSRGGLIAACFDKTNETTAVLTLREVLKMLPDDG